MPDKNNDYIIKLMQNVSDRLDGISTEIKKLKSTNLDHETTTNHDQDIEKIIQTQKVIYGSLNKSIEVLGDNLKEKSSVINQNHQANYVLFGKDTPFSSKLLLSLIAVILLSIPMFKYIPSYLNEKSRITEERDNYKLFYDYAFLHAFDNRKTVPIDLIETLDVIKAKDSTFINYVDRLHSKYNTHLKKENLKLELQKLEE